MYSTCFGHNISIIRSLRLYTQTQPHQISNTHRTENKTTDVVIQQRSRKLRMMDIFMSETCRVHKKWNKLARDIKLVFYSSAIKMIHGPINTRSILFFLLTVRPVCSTSRRELWNYVFFFPVSSTSNYSCKFVSGSYLLQWTFQHETMDSLHLFIF